MGLFDSLFGGKKSQKPSQLTAREACDAAVQTLRETCPDEAGSAYLCCLYTSVHDCNAIVSYSGKCEGWHCDFYLPASKELFLVRIQQGKVKTARKPWQNTVKAPVEYIFALYGMIPELGSPMEPPRLPAQWEDSPRLADAIKRHLTAQAKPDSGLEYEIIMLCMPAANLRDILAPDRREVLNFPLPPPNTMAVICASEELYEEDSVLIYLDATTAEVRRSHTYRYPNLFFFGTSVDW